MAAAAKKRGGNSKFSEDEWSKTGTCLNRPEDGWSHNGEQLELDGGISYSVKVSVWSLLYFILLLKFWSILSNTNYILPQSAV